MAPEVDFVLKAHSVPSWLSLPSSFVSQDVSTQLLLQSHACLSAAVFPSAMVMDSNPLKL